MKEDFLSEPTRAEDILLGSLGIGEEATIVTVELTAKGYRGRARWTDGEEFPFEYDDEIDEMQRWALEILACKNSKSQ